MTISTEPINQETAQVITFLRGIGQGVAAEAKEKLSNPHIALGLLSDRAAALELALASSMGKHGRQFSDKTLAAVDWEEVAAGLDPQHPRRDQKEITTMTEPAILFASTKRLDADDFDWDAWETEQAQKARGEISASLATVTETLNKLAEKSTQIDKSSKEVKTVSENVDYRKNKLSNEEAIFKEKDHLWILAEALPEDERKEIVYMIDHLPGEIMNHEQLQRLHMEVTLLELLPEVGRMTPAIQEALDSLETVYAAIKKVWFEARHAL